MNLTRGTYQPAQNLGQLSSFRVNFPDGGTSTSGLTNFPSQSSLDTVGAAVASAINADADWSATYDSKCSQNQFLQWCL